MFDSLLLSFISIFFLSSLREFSLYCLSILSLLICFLMNMANIVWWNCRGFSARDFVSKILRLVLKFQPMMVCLVEISTNKDRLD